MTKNTKQADSVKGVFIVLNDRGLHTRPSTELVKCASGFRSEVTLYYRKTKVNAKSLLGILMLTACKGARVRVEATGEDAHFAVAEIKSLAARNFNIEY